MKFKIVKVTKKLFSDESTRLADFETSWVMSNIYFFLFLLCEFLKNIHSIYVGRCSEEN